MLAVGQKIREKRSGGAWPFLVVGTSWVGFRGRVSIEKVFLFGVVVSEFGDGTCLFRGIVAKRQAMQVATQVIAGSRQCVSDGNPARTKDLHCTNSGVAGPQMSANNAQSPPWRYAHARPAMRARETMLCFVAQDPLRRCVFGSSERAVRRFRNSRSRH